MKLNRMREDMANSFLNALKEDTIPWRQKWSSMQARPHNAINQSNYHGVNSFWLAFRQIEMGYQDSRWCTFKQASEKGWHIRKGEKGTKVEFWSKYDTKTKKTLNQEQEKELKDTLSPQDFYERVKPIANVYTVFNGEQIEGIPEITVDRHVLDENTLMEKRNVLLKNMAVDLKEGKEEAFYRPSEDCIYMPDMERFENEYAYMSTFLHEAGHATGHESRMNREIRNTFGSAEYAKEELRAEIASAFTAQTLNLPNIDSAHMENHRAYVQNWIEVLEKNPEELFAAIKDAEKISDYLIEKGGFELANKEREQMQEEMNGLQIREIQYGLEKGLDVSVYSRPEFNHQQMEQIRKGMEQGLDVSVYAVPEFNALQMREIWKGQRQGLDVNVYAKREFNFQQMWEIREGMEQGLDVSVYAKHEFNSQQMWEIREGLQQRLDVSTYATPEYDYRKMKEIKEQLSKKKDAVMEFKETHDIPLLSWQDAAKVRLAVKGREVVGPLNPLHIQTAELIKEYQIAGMEMKDIVSNKVDDIGTKLGMEDTQFVKNLVCSIAATSRETYEEYMNCVLKNQPDELVAVSPRLAARLQKEEINIVSIGNNGELHHYSNIGQILEGSGKDFYTAKEPFERILNEQDMPVIQCEWSESYDFDDGKYYTVSEFDKIMKGADTVRVRQKQELIEKYGSSEELLQNGSMEEIAEGCGYAKVKFVVRTGTDRKEDRQDIGNADGGVLDHIRIWDKSHHFTSKLEKGMEQEQQFDQYCQTIMRKKEVDLEMNQERAENLFDKTPSSDMTKEIFSQKTRIRTNAQMLMKDRMRGIEL